MLRVASKLLFGVNASGRRSAKRHEFPSQGTLVALGTGTGTRVPNLGNKLSLEHNELSPVSCHFSIAVQLRCYRISALQQGFLAQPTHKSSMTPDCSHLEATYQVTVPYVRGNPRYSHAPDTASMSALFSLMGTGPAGDAQHRAQSVFKFPCGWQLLRQRNKPTCRSAH
jgi:hypothetical protein